MPQSMGSQRVRCDLAIEQSFLWGLPGGSVIKNFLANAETWFDPWSGKIPWKRKWQPPSVFLPGKSHGQRSLVVSSPLGVTKELDTT